MLARYSTHYLTCLLLVLNTFFCLVAVADTYEEEFWAHRYEVQYDIPYGSHERQVLDIYQQGQWQGPPEYFIADKQLRPTLVYIHGGAWHGGSKRASNWALMPFVQKGWQVINLEYRVGANTAPQAADDVLDAMKWIADNGKQYGVDAQRLVIAGDSAGGHLALLAGLVTGGAKDHARYLGDNITVKAIINWYGITDIAALNQYFIKSKGWNYPKLWAGSSERLNHIINHYSPIHYVSESSPAVMSIHGTKDKVVPITQADTLHRKLKKYGVTNQVVRLEGGRHLGFSDAQFQHIYRQIFQFLKHNMD